MADPVRTGAQHPRAHDGWDDGSLLIVPGGDIAGQLPRGTTDAVPAPVPTPTPTGNVHDVSIHDFAFDPSPLTVRMGDIVRWTNNDARAGQRTVTSDAGSLQSFDSGPLDPVAPGAAAQFQITVTAMQTITIASSTAG